ncbi:MAG: hypothetical protein IJU44_09570 [Kiritimatiellae bacterium]|nr:hypothetical protein [Kiritimatiellia bacterium]
MKKFLVFFSAALAVMSALPGRAEETVLKLPADGKTMVTARMQAEIDRVSAAGGGTIRLPEGTYLTGGLFLKDGVTLRLDKGATLLGSTNHLDYTGHKAVVGAVNAKSVAIEGEGTIDGRGWGTTVKESAPNRWKIAFFYRCRDVRVEGVTLKDPASWTCYFKECEDVVARSVTISSLVNFNNDGFDIDAKNVLIEKCTVDSDDDAICLKSDNPVFVPENVEVRDCRLSSNCNFIKFGTASHGGFKNCRIHHCTLVPASASRIRDWLGLPGVTDPITGLAGIALEMVDGGVMDTIHVHDITMEGGIQTPILIRLGKRKTQGIESSLKNVLIENVTCKAGASLIASSITGVPGMRPQGIILRNLDLTVKGGGRIANAREEIPEVEKAYPENRMFAKKMLPGYGFYLRHADGVRFENVKLRYADGREEREPVVQDDCTEVVFDGCDFMKPGKPLPTGAIVCEGSYPMGHLQGTATDGEAIYWPFTGRIVKTDLKGRVLASTDQPPHQGDLCVVGDTLYVAVNRGEFNKETGAVSEVWSYATKDLSLKNQWKVPELVHGAGGITYRDGLFYVVGGLPPTHKQNYVYVYTPDFHFVKRHVLDTGYTVLGIQTASYERGNFIFGCYYSKEYPTATLVCPPDLSSFKVMSTPTDVGLIDLNGKMFIARTERLPDSKAWCGFLLSVKDSDPLSAIQPVAEAAGR